MINKTIRICTSQASSFFFFWTVNILFLFEAKKFNLKYQYNKIVCQNYINFVNIGVILVALVVYTMYVLQCISVYVIHNNWTIQVLTLLKLCSGKQRSSNIFYFFMCTSTIFFWNGDMYVLMTHLPFTRIRP